MLSVMDVLSAVLGVQSRNLALDAPKLVSAARQVSEIADTQCLAIVPQDKTGERIVGAGMASGLNLNLADTSARFDTMGILLVSGEIAGSAGIAIRASILRSMGAERIEVAVLNGWNDSIEGCQRLWKISHPRELRFHAV